MANFGNQEGSGIGDGDGDGERYIGRGRGRGNKPSNNPPLRRPYYPTAGEKNEVVKNSVLSVDAAEFVPKTFTPSVAPSVTTGSAQDRIQMARQNAAAGRHQSYNWQQSGSSHHYQQRYPNAEPRGYQQQYNHHQFNPSNDFGYINAADDYYNDYDTRSRDSSRQAEPQNFQDYLQQLELGMRTLSMNPGKFDSLVGILVEHLIPSLGTSSECEEIINLLLQKSIDDSNFRYSGARLCTHLDNVSLSLDPPEYVFREILVNRCVQKTEEQIETWKQITKHTDDIEKKCHGLIFFLAELVCQMESTVSSKLAKILIRLMNTVLQNPAANSTKNICQALKLAGGTLERVNCELKAEIEMVMHRLSEIVNQGGVDKSVSRLVSSVTELRSGNWIGTILPSASAQENKQSSSQVPLDEPVYFGPDGKILTDEERMFLEEENNEPTSDPWENDDNADEVAEAFEEFLQLSENNNKANLKNVQKS